MSYSPIKQGMSFCRQRRICRNFGTYRWKLLCKMISEYSLLNGLKPPHLYHVNAFVRNTVQRGMSLHTTKRLTSCYIFRFKYPGELLLLIKLFGESSLKGPRMKKPTINNSPKHLHVNANINIMKSKYSEQEEEAFHASTAKKVFKRITSDPGFDFMFDGNCHLRTCSRCHQVRYNFAALFLCIKVSHSFAVV